MVQIAGKIKCSTTNGEGIRYTLFFSGCPFNCEGCHSVHTQDYSYGNKEKIEDIFYNIIKNKNYIDGVTISGGEALEQAPQLLKLLKLLKVYDIDIWLWTGRTMDVLQKDYKDILDHIDTIIDGVYEINNPTKKVYRGSDNQNMWKKENNIWNKID